MSSRTATTWAMLTACESESWARAGTQALWCRTNGILTTRLSTLPRSYWVGVCILCPSDVQRTRQWAGDCHCHQASALSLANIIWVLLRSSVLVPPDSRHWKSCWGALEAQPSHLPTQLRPGSPSNSPPDRLWPGALGASETHPMQNHWFGISEEYDKEAEGPETEHSWRLRAAQCGFWKVKVKSGSKERWS